MGLQVRAEDGPGHPMKERSTAQSTPVQNLSSSESTNRGAEAWLQLTGMFPLAPAVNIKTLQISFQDLKIRGIYKESWAF